MSWTEEERRRLAETMAGAIEIVVDGDWMEQARVTARELSSRHRNTVFRVYKTPAGNSWVRDDPEPLAQADGMDLVHLAAYLDGEEVGTTRNSFSIPRRRTGEAMTVGDDKNANLEPEEA